MASPRLAVHDRLLATGRLVPKYVTPRKVVEAFTTFSPLAMAM